MPNWCCSSVCFSGKVDNLTKMISDINTAIEDEDKDRRYYNLYYLFKNNNFDTQIYNKNRPRINFAGNIYPNNVIDIDPVTYTGKLYVTFDTAWSMDYNMLHLLSSMYDVEFSAYSEEPNCDVFTKCRNGSEDYYDYDFVLELDHEYMEELFDSGEDTDLDYYMPCRINDIETDELIEYLDTNNIPYTKGDIYEDVDPPLIYGIYYDL